MPDLTPRDGDQPCQLRSPRRHDRGRRNWPWGRFVDSVKTGQPQAAAALGKTAFKYITERPTGKSDFRLGDEATSLNNLARLLRDQGAFAEAQPFCERALAIREKVLGPDHPRTPASLNNLGRILQGQQSLAAARGLFERAVGICEKVLGPEHPYTAVGLNNLSILLRAQDDIAGAQSLCERALAIREKVLGPNHPNTAASLNSLANLLRDQGNLAAARPFTERALAVLIHHRAESWLKIPAKPLMEIVIRLTIESDSEATPCHTIQHGNTSLPKKTVAHSTTSSARARIDGGTVRPSALAVWRLMTNSNVVGCWTGRSAGISPLRILPA
jgi:tetratricopeptide (TPR) repeat protein